ncbi:hypothetical protein [Streptomyces sp. NPDC096030]|uniref:hypothetical protein n=1 Tax=Streptomyces sp. NPDC096030 TaxID=3155423 RepID=UPI00331725BE
MNPNSTPREGLSAPVADSGGESKDRGAGDVNEPQAGAQGIVACSCGHAPGDHAQGRCLPCALRGTPNPQHAYDGNRPEGILHAECAHPDWDYATTQGPRKQWDDADVPPADDNGEPDHTWQRNTDAGNGGWERFDYTEESYWRRPKARTPSDEEPLEAEQASLGLRDAVIDLLKTRANIAEAKARELEGAADVAVRAIQLMNQAGAERDAAIAALADAERRHLEALRDRANVEAEDCCVCRAAPATYWNYRNQAFCTACAHCECTETSCIRDAARSTEAPKEHRNGDTSTCRHCGEAIVFEPRFRDGRGPNPPVWSHTRSGTRTCSNEPEGWTGDRWPMAEPPTA